MPGSDPRARQALIKRIKEVGLPNTILDIGVGAGSYGVEIKSFAPNIIIYGIEIFADYLNHFPKQTKKYKHIFIDDMCTFDYTQVKVDLVIAGDVLEHVIKEDAVKLINTLKQTYPWILVSIPIQVYEQGPDNQWGNIYEEHKYHWNKDEVINDLGMVFIEDCGVCGIFEWRRENVK